MRLFDHELSRWPATVGRSVSGSICSKVASALFAAAICCGFGLATGYASTGLESTTANQTVALTDAIRSYQRSGISGSAGGAVSTVPAAGGLYFYHQIVLTESTQLPVTITNNQSTPLTISSIASAVDYPFTTDCTSGDNGTLAPYATCTVEVSFYPQALGKIDGVLTITHDSTGSPISIPLTGTGIAGEPGITVTVGPHVSCTLPSQTEQFTAIIGGTSNKAVNWYVNNVLNGNSDVGSITTDGLYTAPANLGRYRVKAVSQYSSSAFGATKVEVSNSPGFTIYPYTSSIAPTGQQTFQPQICSAPDGGSVTWTVDNIPDGNATVGTITNSGVYTAPPVPGRHTVRVTDLTLNKTTGAVVTVFPNIAVDFDSRTNTDYPLPADMFGAGRGEALHSVENRKLLTQAGLTVSRLYAQIPLVYATQTPDWTKIDPFIAEVQNAGQKVLLQLSLSPPWLQPNSNPCGTNSDSVAPTDPVKWAQIAASYVAHMNATFPGIVQDYEIWNEPDATGLCAGNHLKSYIDIYSAAAPLMKQQAASDGATIRIGGPVLATYSSLWLTTLLNDPRTAPYIDFVSYHQYMFGREALQVQWDSYNGDASLYQKTQESDNGAQRIYSKVYDAVKVGSQPLGANTPIYISEFNTNWAFFQDCCRNDPTYAPLWNALYVTDLLNIAYQGIPVPNKMIYFASSAYPWFCMIGVLDQNMDCLNSSESALQPYPQYYTFQLLSSRNYLGLVDGGYLAKSVDPPSGSGGLAVTAFYNSRQDAILITNPTSAAYSQTQVTLQNVGFGTPNATLYQIVNGALINSSSLALSPQGTGYSATVDIPAYSVQAISVKGP